MMEITYLESFVEGLNEVMHAKQQLLEAQGKYKIDVRSTVLQIIRKMASLPKITHLWRAYIKLLWLAISTGLT